MIHHFLHASPFDGLVLESPRKQIPQLINLNAAQYLRGAPLVKDFTQDFKGMLARNVRRNHFQKTQPKTEDVQFRRLWGVL